jgi:RimJ/RimL family protein N-acetyltransferase
MRPTILKTARLELILEDTTAVLARIDAMPPEDQAQVSPAWLQQLASSEPSPWTHGFSIVESGSGTVVGSCGFKGAPDAAGWVEIAYAIHPEHRGRGFAKEAANALVWFAYSAGATRVCAHTLQAESPSTSVLTSCGFDKIGGIVDPEDGPVWRWEHRRTN